MCLCFLSCVSLNVRNTSLDEVSSLTELWLGQGRQSDRVVRRVLSYAGSWPGTPGRAGQSRLQHGTTHHHYRSTTRHHHQGVHHLTHLTPPPRAVRRICQDWTNFTSYLGHTSHQPTAHILIDKTLNRHPQLGLTNDQYKCERNPLTLHSIMTAGSL